MIRVTTHMLSQSAAKNGRSQKKSSLLDILNQKSNGKNQLSGMSAIQSSATLLKQKQYSKLEKSGDNLSKYAGVLDSTDKNSVFAKAKENGDTKEIVSNVEKLVEEYNNSLKQLQTTGGTINEYYAKQLQELSGKYKEVLGSVGITQAKDGSLSIDKKALEKADIDSLAKAFGSDSEFTKKLGYLGGNVSEYAAANLYSISSQYNASGVSSGNGFETGKYNFWG